MIAVVVLDPLEAGDVSRARRPCAPCATTWSGRTDRPGPAARPATPAGRRRARRARRGGSGASTVGSGRASRRARRGRPAVAPAMNNVTDVCIVRTHGGQRRRSVPRKARASRGLRGGEDAIEIVLLVEVGHPRDGHGGVGVVVGQRLAGDLGDGATRAPTLLPASPASAARAGARVRARARGRDGGGLGIGRRCGTGAARVPAVVERPATRHDHRVGVALAQCTGAQRIAVGLARRQPHEQPIDVEPEGHRRDVGAPRSLAEPAHRTAQHSRLAGVGTAWSTRRPIAIRPGRARCRR